MHTQSAPKTVPPTVKTYSACWTDELGVAIAAAAPKRGYHMSLTGEDGRMVVSAVEFLVGKTAGFGGGLRFQISILSQVADVSSVTRMPILPRKRLTKNPPETF